MKPDDFIAFVIALLMLYEPVKRLTGIHNIFQQALGASQRVFEYLDPRTSTSRKLLTPSNPARFAKVDSLRRMPVFITLPLS